MSTWFHHNRWRYPDHWKELSRRKRAEADYQCEVCWVRDGAGTARLAVDHINGDTWDCRDRNLLVVCQSCHALKWHHTSSYYDREWVVRTLRGIIEARRSQMVLKIRKVGEPKVFYTPAPKVEEMQEGPECVWWCFDCGANSAEGGTFHTEHYPAGDCDVNCNACGSSHTGEEDDGDRSEPCPVCTKKTVGQVHDDPVCEVCLGYATVFPYVAAKYGGENSD
jgi:hypothetical protein